MILGRRYRYTAHVLKLHEMEVAAPSRHEAVAKYRKGTGTQKIAKYDYTSYEADTPYYTMIIMENRQKIKLLLDLSQENAGGAQKKLSRPSISDRICRIKIRVTADRLCMYI